MKYNLDESVTIVENRIRNRKIRKLRRSICSLCALCAALIGLAVFSLYSFISFGKVGNSHSVYGTLMISNEAGGYVLVGVVSFFSAVALTLLCLYIRRRKHSPADNSSDSDK